jgi:phosphotransferase system IIA component
MWGFNEIWSRKTIKKFYWKVIKKINIIQYCNSLLIFIYWLFSNELELRSPVRSIKYSEEKNNLLGKTYCFEIVDEKLIKSPISGKLIKVFSDQKSVLISSKYYGLQLVIRIKEKIESKDKNCILLLKVNANVKDGENIFQINKVNSADSVLICIPWQPLIVKSIKDLTISFKNPLDNNC